MEKNGKRFLSAMIAATLALGLMGGYSIKADMKQRTAEIYQNETNDETEGLTSKESEESVTVRVSCTEEGKEHIVDYVADDIDTHHGECAVCGEKLSESEPHTWEEQEKHQEGKVTTTVYKCPLCEAQKTVKVTENEIVDIIQQTTTATGAVSDDDHENNKPTQKPEDYNVKIGSVVKSGDSTFVITKLPDGKVGKATLTKIGAKDTSYVVPDFMVVQGQKFRITSIKSKAFYKKKKLKKVIIGRYVKSVGTKAFYGCKKLKNVTIKATVLKTVGKQSFSGIYKKATFKVPKSKYKRYKKLLGKKAGIKKTMKIKK